MVKGIGYFLGFFVGGILTTLVINWLYFNHLTPTQENIKIFTDDLETITDEVIDDVTKEYIIAYLEKGGNHLGTNSGAVVTSFSRSGSSEIYYVSYIYYSRKYKKHFQVFAFSQGINALSRMANREPTRYYLTVNKKQLNDLAYGDLQNPVPVFQIKGIKESMREKQLDYDEGYMKEFFDKNIYGYLYYFISKEEFFKLFPERKNFWNSLFY